MYTGFGPHVQICSVCGAFFSGGTDWVACAPDGSMIEHRGGEESHQEQEVGYLGYVTGGFWDGVNWLNWSQLVARLCTMTRTLEPGYNNVLTCSRLQLTHLCELITTAQGLRRNSWLSREEHRCNNQLFLCTQQRPLSKKIRLASDQF